MHKLNPIPRLSIVVPIGHDTSAFETTLLSELENRPGGCEILVAHDGSYDDPFQLSDEVRFVVAASERLLDSVADAASQAKGRFIHVLSDGLTAGKQWTDAALEKFEHHDAGIVAIVIRQSQNKGIVAAGWRDANNRLCTPIGEGRKQLDARDATSIVGGYLQASFWRRDLLRCLTHTLRTNDVTEAVYAHTHVAARAGWKTILATESEVYCQHATLPWDQPSLRRGRRLRAIREVLSSGDGGSLGHATKALLSNAFRPAYYGESIGQAMAALSVSAIDKRLDRDAIRGVDHEAATTIPLPQFRTAATQHRRAA